MIMTYYRTATDPRNIRIFTDKYMLAVCDALDCNAHDGSVEDGQVLKINGKYFEVCVSSDTLECFPSSLLHEVDINNIEHDVALALLETIRYYLL